MTVIKPDGELTANLADYFMERAKVASLNKFGSCPPEVISGYLHACVVIYDSQVISHANERRIEARREDDAERRKL
jgi:hypothetical protein